MTKAPKTLSSGSSKPTNLRIISLSLASLKNIILKVTTKNFIDGEICISSCYELNYLSKQTCTNCESSKSHQHPGLKSRPGGNSGGNYHFACFFAPLGVLFTTIRHFVQVAPHLFKQSPTQPNAVNAMQKLSYNGAYPRCCC